MAKVTTSVDFSAKEVLDLVAEAGKKALPENGKQLGGCKVEWSYESDTNGKPVVFAGAIVTFTK